ncbi:MAG TPA: AAA family ATPase, partial [bacterium]
MLRPVLPIAPAVEPIRIHTLGQFRVLVEGEPVHLQSKASKPLQLLKVLIALGAESVSIHQLTDSLWPKADGDRAYGAFTITLKRLRELVGQQGLILRAGRLSLNAKHCWVDAIEFGTRASEASRALRLGDDVLAFAKFNEALECYAGPFLPGEFDPPEKLSARAQLHGIFLRSVEEFGGYRHAQGRLDDAVAIYRRALETDDQAESIHRQLITCLLVQDRLGECIAAYQRCRELLQATAGATPSPETEALYQAALQRQQARAGEAPARATSDILEPPSPLGERKRATVACLRFHLPAGTQNGEEAAHVRLLRNLHAEALAMAARHGGSVSPEPGPSILAWFGHPVAHDDDPCRALRTALQLRDRLRAIPTADADSGVGLSVGVATGLFQMAPGTLELGHLPTGNPIAQALDLADGAEAGHVLADAGTWSLAQDYFSGAEVSHDAAARYEVLRAVNITSRFEAALRRGLSPFVSREWELESLRRGLEAARQGQGQVISLIGEAGIGKTRLAHEFRRAIDRDQFWVVEGRCQPDGAGRPYGPLLDVIRRGTMLNEVADMEALHALAVERLGASSPEMRQYLPHLLHLLGIPSAEHPLPEGLQGPARRHAMEDAISALLASTSAVRPLVLILEDWHWTDEDSDAALYAVLRHLHRLHMLVIVVYRPEFQPKWAGLDHHRALRIGPLDSAATGNLLCSVLGATELPVGLAAMVHDRTQGNALFVEEMALALAAAAPTVEPAVMPATVDAVIRARIDRLEPLERETLRLAAVVGQTVDVAILEQIAPQPERVGMALHRLSNSGLLHPLRLSEGAPYEFKHVLTREVAYASLLPEQRPALHRRAGQAIEATYGGALEPHYESLAWHFEHSDQPAKAVSYLELMGDQARVTHAVKTARSSYQRGLSMLALLPDRSNRSTAVVDLTVKLASVSEYSPSVVLLESLRTARESAAALEDPRRLALANYWSGRLRYIRGEFPEATSHYDTAMRLAQETDSEALYARCLNAAGRTCVHTAEHERGVGLLTHGIALMEATGDMLEVSYSCNLLGIHHAVMGNFAEALRFARRGLAIA